tara:strand:+ start:10202 stop:10609 length:408 start_codon:yes stop_codon:yes gene_type:complete
MLLTSSKTRNERLEICRGCKHFVSVTQSCGTLGVGKTVKYKNTSKKLCGCIMPIKTHLKIGSCPLNKWKSEVNKKDIESLKSLLGSIEKNRITKEQNMKLTELYNKITHKKNKVSGCAPCVKKMVTEMSEMLKDE